MNFPTFIDAETPSGTLNGSNVNFTLAQLPAATPNLYLNGLYQLNTVDYNIIGQNITFVSAPVTGSVLLAYYFVNNGTSPTPTCQFSYNEIPVGTQDGTNLVFTIANTPLSSTCVRVFRNGMLLDSGVDYTLTGQFLDFFVAPGVTDSLSVFYRYAGSGNYVLNLVQGEKPGGTINGINTVFTLANVPSPTSSLEVIYDGLTLPANAFNVTNDLILLTPPISLSTLYVNYSYPSAYQVTKVFIYPYLRRYLNDVNANLWPDSDLLQYINDAETDITSFISIIWTRVELNIQLGVGTYQMPNLFKSIYKISYRGFEVVTLDQNQIQTMSPVYRTQEGLPRWANIEYEGYNTLRLFPVPAENLPPLSTGSQIYTDENIKNTCVVSYFQFADPTNTLLQLPIWMERRLVKAYVCWKCFQKEGKGQDLKVAAYYQNKYKNMLGDAKIYVDRIVGANRRQLGLGGIRYPWRKARPILPPNYGPIVRF